MFKCTAWGQKGKNPKNLFGLGTPTLYSQTCIGATQPLKCSHWHLYTIPVARMNVLSLRTISTYQRNKTGHKKVRYS